MKGSNDRRKVYWELQKKVEYYETSRCGTWIRVSNTVGDEWKTTEFEYHELRGDQAPDAAGNLGPYINW